MKKNHQKHPPLARPNRGFYHRTEWSIYGTTCGNIATFFKELDTRLNDVILTYVDADHHVEALQTDIQIGKKQFHQSAALEWNEYDDKLHGLPADAVLVNGNHYPAERQVVFIDSKKKDSLQRRVEQLCQIDMVLLKEGEETVFDFVQAKMSEETLLLKASDWEQIEAFFRKEIKKNIPQLKALILAGGKSTRMGTDKSQIDYHGTTQELYLAGLCRDLGLEPYLSKAHDFGEMKVEGTPVIKDKLVQMGPFGAILSAMMQDPNAAWLVLACDLPMLQEATLKTLIDARNPSKYATAFRGTSKRFPEPLITIYEPKAYSRMLQFMSLGYACPRKALINSVIEEILLEDETPIMNVNTVKEKEAAIKKIDTAM